MKLLSFRIGDTVRPGVLLNHEVLDLTTVGTGRIPNTMEEICKEGDRVLDVIDKATRAGEGICLSLEDLDITAPLHNPGKIIAIGLNYRDHARETGSCIPQKPIVFSKFASTITGPQDEVRWSSAITSQVDYEVELGVVIGQSGKHINTQNALEHVFGYMVLNDISARDLQKSDPAGQWDLGKCLDGFCPCGPYLVTRDEIPDPQNLSLTCAVNGQVLQDSNTSEMIFSVDQLISYLSRVCTLNGGDIIATGTPAGVGMARDPQVFLQNGDLLETSIGQLGKQRIRIGVDL